MQFCKKCDNMYYMKVDDENNLKYICKYCNHEDTEIINTTNMKVYKYSKESKQKMINVNRYTKYDPTLPHMTTIKCPNIECIANQNNNQSVQQDVVYLRYDTENMKFTYLCCNCDFQWNP